MPCDGCLKAPTLAISTPAAAAIIGYLQRQSPPMRITSWAQNYPRSADCCIPIIRNHQDHEPFKISSLDTPNHCSVSSPLLRLQLRCNLTSCCFEMVDLRRKPIGQT
eukprot:scaffold40469_cov72-Cyclotella_meneghiniana.AAC.3